MKRLLAATALLAAGSAAVAADPYAGYIYPAGIQAGATNRFVVGGQNMWSLQGVYFGNSGNSGQTGTEIFIYEGNRMPSAEERPSRSPFRSMWC